MTSILEQECTLSSVDIMKLIKDTQAQENRLWIDYRNALVKEAKEKNNGKAI